MSSCNWRFFANQMQSNHLLAIDDKSTPTDKFARIGYLKFRGDVVYDASSDGGCSAASFANSAHAPRRINYSRGWA